MSTLQDLDNKNVIFVQEAESVGCVCVCGGGGGDGRCYEGMCMVVR